MANNKYRDPSLPPEFWENFTCPKRATSCWPWRGTHESTGYVRFRGRPAHRVVYEALVGPIPEGLVIDHLCHNKLCMNPEHLEAVTSVENLNRRRSHPTRKELRDDDRRGLSYNEWRPRTKPRHRPACLFCGKSWGHDESCRRPRTRSGRSVKLRRANKDHRCSQCAGVIRTGERYRYRLNDGGLSSIKQCAQCLDPRILVMPQPPRRRRRKMKPV
jgi:hypothetical protein